MGAPHRRSRMGLVRLPQHAAAEGSRHSGQGRGGRLPVAWRYCATGRAVRHSPNGRCGRREQDDLSRHSFKLWNSLRNASWSGIRLHSARGERLGRQAAIQRHQSQAQCPEQPTATRRGPDRFPERLRRHGCYHADNRQPEGRPAGSQYSRAGHRVCPAVSSISYTGRRRRCARRDRLCISAIDLPGHHARCRAAFRATG